jgi:hypothetical protein
MQSSSNRLVPDDTPTRVSNPKTMQRGIGSKKISKPRNLFGRASFLMLNRGPVAVFTTFGDTDGKESLIGRIDWKE